MTLRDLLNRWRDVGEPPEDIDLDAYSPPFSIEIAADGGIVSIEEHILHPGAAMWDEEDGFRFTVMIEEAMPGQVPLQLHGERGEEIRIGGLASLSPDQARALAEALQQAADAAEGGLSWDDIEDYPTVDDSHDTGRGDADE